MPPQNYHNINRLSYAHTYMIAIAFYMVRGHVLGVAI